jgi:hypothetical protein
MSVSRRDLIKSLGVTTAAGSILRVVPLEAAEKAHRMVSAQKAASPSGDYTLKFCSAHQYKTLRALCQEIIPRIKEAAEHSKPAQPNSLICSPAKPPFHQTIDHPSV